MQLDHLVHERQTFRAGLIYCCFNSCYHFYKNHCSAAISITAFSISTNVTVAASFTVVFIVTTATAAISITAASISTTATATAAATFHMG